jgi:hypothetical protein
MTRLQDVTELLATHELAIMALYEAFADAFPGQRELWQSIAADEQGHADALLRLRQDNPAATEAAFSQFKARAVLSSIAFVEEKTAQARNGGLTHVAALSLGRELESALLEDSFFKAGRQAPSAMRPVLAQLSAETRRHQTVIEAALAAETA